MKTGLAHAASLGSTISQLLISSETEAARIDIMSEFHNTKRGETVFPVGNQLSFFVAVSRLVTYMPTLLPAQREAFL